MRWFIEAWRKFAVFEGRARRKEYLAFFVLNYVVAVLLNILDQQLGGRNGIAPSFLAVTLVPSVAVGVRRMHDTDHSGWWLLVPVVNAVFSLSAGTRGANNYGFDPKD